MLSIWKFCSLFFPESPQTDRMPTNSTGLANGLPWLKPPVPSVKRFVLSPPPTESKNWNTTENLYIEGDNLDVLKLLQESYLGKVKMIYIDPPYNTGHDFIYKDSFRMDEDAYSAQTELFDEEGNRQLTKNNDSNPRFHSDWCSMMYSRLLLARNLLTDDGVIFISIDDHEQENLKKICNEIFGEQNFISTIVWEKVHTRKNSALYFSSSHEYLLCYAKHKRSNSMDNYGFKRNLLPREDSNAYSNPDNDPRGPWKADPITAHNYYAADYTIVSPNGAVITKPQDRYWAYSKASIDYFIKNNMIIWGDGSHLPMVKRYLSDVQNGIVPVTLFTRKFAGDTSQAKKNIDELFPQCKGIFDYTKPVKLIYDLLLIGSNSNDIILDFFSGSATTAHAVMQLNAEDGGHRKFIMVQLPEACDLESKAYKAGYKTICDIGKERIRRAGEKIQKEHPEVQLDTGFRVFRVDDSPMEDVYYSAGTYTQDTLTGMISNIKPDRTALDLFFSCILDWGLPLDLPYTIEEICGYAVHNYNDGMMLACFADAISEELIGAMARKQPVRVVFRDSSFPDSPAKINAEEIFKRYSPNTLIKVI